MRARRNNTLCLLLASLSILMMRALTLRSFASPIRVVGRSVSLRSSWRNLRMSARRNKNSGEEIRSDDSIANGPVLVIVESPAKAKTIQRFLDASRIGKYVVESCRGHIRQLAKVSAKGRRKGEDVNEMVCKALQITVGDLGVDVFDDFKPIYEVDKSKKEVIERLKQHAAEASRILLATDEDREGEAISWHLVEVLQPVVPYERAVFHEITQSAIEAAFASPRRIDYDLVHAQETRQILDKLAGFTLSPLLWRYLEQGLSAGRVQSCGLKLIAQRWNAAIDLFEGEQRIVKEIARWSFMPSKYFSLSATFFAETTPALHRPFIARLVQYEGQKIATEKDFDGKTGTVQKGSKVLVLDETKCRELLAWLSQPDVFYVVTNTSAKTSKRSPAPPFVTSTLQQEASRKLGLSPARCMQIAQELYENGRITYMRTDSPSLSTQALGAAKSLINELFGEEYLPTAEVTAKSKLKNAQEAHEAIRPVETNGKFALPEATGLSGDALRLYDLIFRRTLAACMKPSTSCTTTITIAASTANTEDSREAVFRASETVLTFAGYLAAWQRGKKGMESEKTIGFDLLRSHQSVQLTQPGEENKLSAQEGEEEEEETQEETEVVRDFQLEHVQHHPGLRYAAHETRPPARFTEASFVQELEALGVGRPSTYASILNVLKERGYVSVEQRTLLPTMRGLLVAEFLQRHFPQFIHEEFTAKMEEALDQIAKGKLDKLRFLQQFYFGDEHGEAHGMLRSIEAKLSQETIDRETSRLLTIPFLQDLGRVLVVRKGCYLRPHNSENGSMFRLPVDIDSDARSISRDAVVQAMTVASSLPSDSIGLHPVTQEPVYLRSGIYGPYLQVGEQRISLPKAVPMATVEFEDLLPYLSLPLQLGTHPNHNEPIMLSVFSQNLHVYFNHSSWSMPLPADAWKIHEIDREQVIADLLQANTTQQSVQINGRSVKIRDIGMHDKKMITLFNGPYGHYLRHANRFIGCQKVDEIETLTLEQAIELISASRKGKKNTSPSNSATSTKAKSKSNASNSTAKPVTKSTARRRAAVTVDDMAVDDAQGLTKSRPRAKKQLVSSGDKASDVPQGLKTRSRSKKQPVNSTAEV